MLPSRGCCHAVFLLVFTSRLKSYANVEAWVEATRARATIMAAALNLGDVASALVALNLVELPSISIANSLQAAGDEGSTQTFSRIARVLLERSPPPWLRIAVDGDRLNRDYIPAADLEALAWLEEGLDQILLDVCQSLELEETKIPKAIGDAAELLIVASLKRMGGSVVHVAKISDGYGYDIEWRRGNRTRRIEVKACSAKTSDRFILTRNEFEKSQIFRSEWSLVQVVFKVGSLFGSTLSADDVVELRELLPQAISDLCPADSSTFRWRESAELRPQCNQWIGCQIELDPKCSTPLSR